MQLRTPSPRAIRVDDVIIVNWNYVIMIIFVLHHSLWRHGIDSIYPFQRHILLWWRLGFGCYVRKIMYQTEQENMCRVSYPVVKQCSRSVWVPSIGVQSDVGYACLQLVSRSQTLTVRVWLRETSLQLGLLPLSPALWGVAIGLIAYQQYLVPLRLV